MPDSDLDGDPAVYDPLYNERGIPGNRGYESDRHCKPEDTGAVYLEGSAPQDYGEVGISHLIAKRLGAHIGDIVSIHYGDQEHDYLVTAIFQTMNNLGEGIRFYEKEQLDYSYVFGSFGIQLLYTDEPEFRY